MNSKIYRCGWCGCPTNEKGQNLEGKDFKRVVNIIEKYGDSHTEKTHGDCCIREHTETRMRITKDMAIDAGDLNLEGEYY